MGVTVRDFDALTPQQRDAVGRVAIGDHSGHNPRTLAALERRGLIVSREETLPGRFPIVVRRYVMPIAVHMVWCAWCSTQPESAP